MKGKNVLDSDIKSYENAHKSQNFSSKTKSMLERKCAICGDADCKLDCDHIISISDGGGDDVTNAQYLCKEVCHKWKSSEDLKWQSKVFPEHKEWLWLLFNHKSMEAYEASLKALDKASFEGIRSTITKG